MHLTAIIKITHEWEGECVCAGDVCICASMNACVCISLWRLEVKLMVLFQI